MPFVNPYTAQKRIKPRTNKKYPKIIPIVVSLNPGGKGFLKIHITSKGVPGKIIVVATIKAKNAAKNRIMATIKTPFGLLFILKSNAAF